tara:strand:+ start:94 stop:1002 length:909 start_codon:yes stop_codon:yes gene_type:complete
MISVQQMRYIIVLSEELHFEKASKKCFVTQPTLSMQIKKAEDLLGQKLFDRSRQPMKVTKFGIQLLPIIRNIMFELNKVDEIVKKTAGTFQEEIRLGVIPTVSNYLIPKLYGAWKKSFPDLNIIIHEYTTENLIALLEKKELDLGVFAGPYTHNSCTTQTLFLEQILIYAPSLSSEYVELDTLKRMKPWLLTKENCLRNQMVSFCNIDESEKKWSYEGGNIELLKRMVEEHGGYTLVPKYYSEESPELKPIMNKEMVPVREIIGVYPSRSTKNSLIDKILKSIRVQYPSDLNKSKKIVLDWK